MTNEQLQRGRKCPVCGQGGLHKVRIQNLENQEAALCAECDAFWVDGNSNDLEAYERFEVFMEKRGLTADWHKVEVID